MPAATTAGGQQSDSLHLIGIWDTADLSPGTPFEAFDTYGPVLVHLSDTPRPLFVSLNDNARLYVIDPLSGSIRAEFTTPHPGGDTWWTRTLNGVAVGDMDDDGRSDLLVLNTGGMLTRFERDPLRDTPDRLGFVRHWSVFAFAPAHQERYFDLHEWLQPVIPEKRSHLAHGHPFLAPPTSGGDETWVYAQSDDLPGSFAFDAEGALRWLGGWHDGHAGPWVGPLGPAREQTTLFSTDGGKVVARAADDGHVRWVFEAPKDVQPGAISVPPVVSDLDGDGRSEVFVAARVAVEDPLDPEWMHKQRARLMLLDDAGQMRWQAEHPAGNPLVHTEAVPHDVDDDGVLDLVVLDWNTIGHSPGDFERLGPGNLFALDGATGHLLWTTQVDAPATDGNFPVAGFARRDAAVLVPHAQDGRPGLGVVDLQNGAHLRWAPLPEGWDSTRGVVVADLTGDGFLEAVVTLARDGGGSSCVPKPSVGCRTGALATYRTDARADSLLASGGHTRSAAAPPDPAIEPEPGQPEAAIGTAVSEDARVDEAPPFEAERGRPAAAALLMVFVALQAVGRSRLGRE